MSFLVGVTLLLVLQLIGEVTVRLLAWPVPGPVLGMILLFVFLLARKGVSNPWLRPVPGCWPIYPFCSCRPGWA